MARSDVVFGVELVYYIPDFLLAVIACWLGMSLLVWIPWDRAIRAFAWFCINLALYGLMSLLHQLTIDSPVSVNQGIYRFQIITTIITPVAFLHFIAVLTTSGYLTMFRRLAVMVFYISGIVLSLYALFAPLSNLLMPLISWRGILLPSGWFNWGWVLQRIIPLSLALVLMWLAYRRPTGDMQERLLRRILATTSVIGVMGAISATVARSLSASAFIPRSIILVAMVILAYGVLMHRALLPPRIAQRTFFYSILGSLATAVYVGLLFVLENLVNTWLSIDAPVVTIFSLVVLIAVLGPVREWFRDLLDRRFYRREFDYGRLMRTLNRDIFERGDINDQLQGALSTICRSLGVQAGLIALTTSEGLVPRATYGQLVQDAMPQDTHWFHEQRHEEERWRLWQSAKLVLSLRRGDAELGILSLGQRRSLQPFGSTERALIDYLGNYLVLAITHAQAREEQQEAIAALATQSQALREQQEQLARQANEAGSWEQHRTEPADGGLIVYALGSLRVERNGTPITRWGGNKAGTYQAEALFAFLFDRRGKGMTKDEAEEVIWPDLMIEKADAAFHRTIAGLRRTLEPNLRRGNESRTILYHHERYWLEPSLISWSDTDELVFLVRKGITQFHQDDYVSALALLEQANTLYRGDYMDDCPFFGDSVYVEEQRGALRTCYLDAQLALGVIYEAQKRVGEAMAAYRRVLAFSSEGCHAANEGLERLGLSDKR